MTETSKKTKLTLIALDIEGDWNIPLLQSAADMSGVSVEFAADALPSNPHPSANDSMMSVAEILDKYNHVLACETGGNSRSVYEFPSPRGSTAVIVGNELNGIPKRLLNRVSQIVSIPMSGKGMSSVNVAVAAAISLYALERNLGRKHIKESKLSHRNVDILLHSPENPSELGSLLRSTWAFGWRRVCLSSGNRTNVSWQNTS